MNALLKDKLPDVIKTLKRHRVARAYAFGSVVGTNFTKDSDVDIIVAFDIAEPFEGYSENFWSLQDELNSLLARKVDLVPEHTLQNTYFIKEVERTKVPLYE